ncbi:hypothetical protein BJY00DRAFT_324732 [Aspergillus carlsbadensis]|nr:hypothetical protein BJY00DRAFT_324732 [Aspergillus carlsbadensis]
MNRQRRAHVKSREGCTQCKERHVKCNEVHPQCLSCRQKELMCSFSAPILTTPLLSQDSLADLELLDYWHRHHIPPNAARQATRLEDDVVRLGFSYPYLLNAILALAALQLFDEDRSQTRWYIRAVAHRQAAITRARPQFENLEESHHRALLSFSFYTSMYALAEPLLRPPPPSRDQPNLDPVKELLQAIQFGRCSRTLVQRHLASVSCSDPFLMAKYNPCNLEAIQGLELRFSQLAWLQGFIKRHCEGQEKMVCLHAAESLFLSLALLVDNPDDATQLRAIWGWASKVDSAFLDMCSARNQVALVIFAHFAAVMTLGRGNWYLQGWPTVLLRQIRCFLKDDWEDAIRWPEEVVFGNQPILPPAT